MLKQIYSKIIRWQYKKIVNRLTTRDPGLMLRDGEKRLLTAFKSKAARVPFYKNLLDKAGIDPGEITTIDQFSAKVPVLDKTTVFTDNPITGFCLDGHIDDISLVYSSSGYSSEFSFGAETWKNQSKMAIGLEFLLDTAFDIFTQKTFLINCLPMGVKVFTRTLPVAETSVREDVVLAMIDKLKNHFEQFILVGESLFLKRVVEKGVESSIPWEEIKVNLITGGEYIPETWRSYISRLLHVDPENPENGIVAVNMGLSELTLSVLSENPELIKLRGHLCENVSLRNDLFGMPVSTPPVMMQYFPQQTWLENISDIEGMPQLVVSMLEPELKIPLIRYNTGDCVKLRSYHEVKEILGDYDLLHLIPKFNLPFGIVMGKQLPVKSSSGDTLTVHEVKEALYKNHSFAGKITGNFRLESHDRDIHLLIQIKRDKDISDSEKQLFVSALKEYCSFDPIVEYLHYLDFPYGIEHNFEKKNRYI